VVFDREPEPLNLPRAVHFDGEVMRVFQSIGIADEVSEVIRLSRGVRYYGASGDLLMERRPPTETGRHLWADKNMFHQPDLERTLRAGMERYPNVQVLLEHEVLDVRDAGDAVELDVEHLVSGEKSRWRVAYAVGSDGGRSLLRRTMGTVLEDFGVHDPWLVVDVELDEEMDLPDCTVQYCDPERPTTYVHVTGNRRRWEFKIMPGDDQEALTSPESVWSLLAPWVNRQNASITRSSIYTFHALVAERWREGRLFLAGDSAHQTPPFLGQGMCTGVRDAANLGWKLARVCAGAPDSLLDTYESERRSHAQVFVETAARLGGIIQTTDPVRAAARDAEMLVGGTIEFKDPAPPLGPGLHIHDGIGGTIPGQPLLSTGVRLDDAVGARFAAVVSSSLGGNGGAARVIAQSIDAAWVEDAAADAWLAALGAQAVVLRPDRYAVGAAADAAELAALLELVRAATAA
jgi:3-(3-hydroxy-phenyl)propionate hydroxylase